MDVIYLDNNATTQPLPSVVEAVREMLESHWGNPSSVHRFGQMVRQRVELARQQVATLLNCRPRELLFTSGGTESNNLALRGSLARLASRGPCVLITTKIEHAAIREPADLIRKQGGPVRELTMDRFGRVSPHELTTRVKQADTELSPGSFVVSIQWANNETGVIQPMTELAAACAALREELGKPVVFHSDATQAVGKLPVDVSTLPIDLLTLAAHKFHGPKGVGALYVRPGVKLLPQNVGGPQEREQRGGTENTPGIVGMGVAAEAAAAFLDDTTAIDRVRKLRDRLESLLTEARPDAVVHSRGDGVERLWNTTNVGFPRLEAEAILLALSEKGVCASAGAACSSGSLEPSPVLLAMGIPEPVAHGSIRLSLSRFTADNEIEQAATLLLAVVARLSRTLPMAV